MVELAVAQVEVGHEVTIISAESSDSIREHRGVTILGVHVRSPRPLRDYEMLIAARKYLKNEPPDILHFHGEREGARLNGYLDVPMVLSVDYFRYRFSSNWLGHQYFKDSLRRFDRLLPVSQACAIEFEGFWGSPSATEVLFNGVNTNQFRPDPEAGAKVRMELKLQGTIVMYVGRLCEQKGTDVLLDAWEEIRPTNSTLVVVGPIGQFGTNPTSGYHSRMSSLGVRYLGAVEEQRLADIYNASDVFVMPTVRDEMFGMAALEAQACGKPVIASRLGGLVEAVGSKSGMFVEPGNSRELGVAIMELLQDEGLRRTMSLEARSHSAAFSWSRIAEKAQSIYTSISS
jgi:glycosyltransferase involved in cell wall biosynthesis